MCHNLQRRIPIEWKGKSTKSVASSCKNTVRIRDLHSTLVKMLPDDYLRVTLDQFCCKQNFGDQSTQAQTQKHDTKKVQISDTLV